jgi:hypothetical protein
MQLHNDWLQTTWFPLMIAIVLIKEYFLKWPSNSLWPNIVFTPSWIFFHKWMKRHPITRHLELKPHPLIPQWYPSILCNKNCDNYSPLPNITHAIWYNAFFLTPIHTCNHQTPNPYLWLDLPIILNTILLDHEFHHRSFFEGWAIHECTFMGCSSIHNGCSIIGRCLIMSVLILCQCQNPTQDSFQNYFTRHHRP